VLRQHVHEFSHGQRPYPASGRRTGSVRVY
jgi:hypothetical protein